MENINDYMPLSNDFNKERLETLKKLFPDLFTNEGKLNIDELKKVVDPKSVSETERYEFRWFGKSQAKRNAFTPSNATLVYDEHRSVNPMESENLIIEGENLEVLKLLSDSYREKIKCIYIDPPYNTGKDFVYSDNFSQDKKAYWEDAGVTEDGLKIDTNAETDGRYHSNWLNMMYSRLLIARQLLREDGVIFISIDDNEVHHLRKLCDEVFGEENFVASYLWKKKGTTTNVEGAKVSSLTEYIICYKKSDNDGMNYRIVKKETRNYPYRDIEGQFRTTVIEKKNAGSYERKTMQFEIIGQKPRIGKRWQIGEETARGLEKKKRFFIEDKVVKLKIYDFEDEDTTSAFPNLLFENGSTDSASKELERFFNIEELFDNPKPTELIKQLIRYCGNPLENGITLNFFGGSGTTGQAIIELNKEDGGNRKLILVQIPEATDEKSEAYKAGFKKISDITIERNKRVVQKLIEDKKNKQPDLFTNGYKEDAIKGLGFKVFKLVKSNFPRVEFAPDPENTEEENIELLKKYIRDKEAQLVTAFNRDELMTEILLKKGFNLNYTTEKQEQFRKNEIYLATDPASSGTSSEKETLICLDVTIEMETVEYFKKHTDKKFICLERALDTTKKYNLKHYMGDMFNAF